MSFENPVDTPLPQADRTMLSPKNKCFSSLALWIHFLKSNYFQKQLLVLLFYWCPKDTYSLCPLRATTHKKGGGGSWKILLTPWLPETYQEWKWSYPVTLNRPLAKGTRIHFARASSFSNNPRLSQTVSLSQYALFSSAIIIQTKFTSPGGDILSRPPLY